MTRPIVDTSPDPEVKIGQVRQRVTRLERRPAALAAAAAAGVPYCYAQTSPLVNLATNNPGYLNITSFVTSDATVFTKVSRTISAQTCFGVSFGKTGVYVGFYGCQWGTGLVGNDDVLFFRQPGVDVVPSKYIGPQPETLVNAAMYAIFQLDQSFIEAYEVDAGTTPTQSIVMSGTNYTANRGTISGQVLYVYLGAGTLF